MNRSTNKLKGARKKNYCRTKHLCISSIRVQARFAFYRLLFQERRPNLNDWNYRSTKQSQIMPCVNAAQGLIRLLFTSWAFGVIAVTIGKSTVNGIMACHNNPRLNTLVKLRQRKNHDRKSAVTRTRFARSDGRAACWRSFSSQAYCADPGSNSCTPTQ